MSFPTTDYTASRVEYHISTQVDATVRASLDLAELPDSDHEDLLQHFEDALSAFRIAYQTATSKTLTVSRNFVGATPVATL